MESFNEIILKRAVFSVANLSGLVLLVFSLFVHADSQQVVDYNYDGAGNIVSVRTGQNLGPPDVINFSPAFVNKNGNALVTATGNNLHKTTVTTVTSGLSVSDVINVSESEIQFMLTANNIAVTGLGELIFTSRVGVAIETIVIADLTPVVTTMPSPIVLATNTQPVEVKLVFDQPFATDQTYDVAIRDTSVATIVEQTVNLLTGSQEAVINLSGLTEGNTFLEVNQLSNFLAINIPVRVNSVAGLVAAWPFDDGVNPTEDIVGGEVGNIIGSTFTTSDIAPVTNNLSALIFNGVGDKVVINDADHLDFGSSSPMSIAFWFKATSFRSVSHLLGKRVGCGSMNYQIARDAGLLHFNSNAGRVNAGVDIQINQFMHMVVTYDGINTLKIYIDGTEVASNTNYVLQGVNLAPLTIGASNTCGNDFPGIIDEVQIYNRAITPAEILILLSDTSFISDDVKSTAQNSNAYPAISAIDYLDKKTYITEMFTNSKEFTMPSNTIAMY